MRIGVSDWMIADGDIPTPRPGVVLRGVGLRLRRNDAAVRTGGLEEVQGAVAWKRLDEPNRLVELVLDAGGWSVLVESDWAWRSEHVSIGQTYGAKGRLSVIGEYEFEDFALPDIRADWTVEAAQRGGPLGDWQIDVVRADS